jgi:DNA replication licensing factor MCM4
VKGTTRNRRGDIHSSLSLTPTSTAVNTQSQAQRRKKPMSTLSQVSHSSDFDGDGMGLGDDEDTRMDLPPSSSGPDGLNLPALHKNRTSNENGLAPPMSAAAPAASDEPDEMRSVWGTTVSIAETMRLFSTFLRGFKPKYRAALDRAQGSKEAQQQTNAAHTTEMEETTESEEMTEEARAKSEVLLYETYLRRMRQTGETDLNLDVRNLLAYPPSKKLHAQLLRYPQEVVPALDQALKDVLLELAEQDAEEGREGMEGDEGEKEIAEIVGKVYKIRPYGVTSVNMRELNPTGGYLCLGCGFVFESSFGFDVVGTFGVGLDSVLLRATLLLFHV